ncbi:MAG TPA: response regulator, partial [Nevskiaceae bacterium]|nr:response regulator [Nevskiaceae bacterium]
GGVIRVTAWASADECVLQVRDSGIGIDEDLLPRIFDLFTQGNQRLDRREGGLGIGLALVRQIVELHGGEVRGRSSGPGRGSEFTVRLPGIPAPPAAVAPETSQAIAPTATPLRILLVEDNADARESLHILLEMLGHDVHEAADGRSGVEMTLRLKPDIALIDIGLPELDGYEVARALRAQGASLRLVAVTGYGQPDDVQKARQAGFDRHLVKPITLPDLERELAECPAPKQESPTPA